VGYQLGRLLDSPYQTSVDTSLGMNPTMARDPRNMFFSLFKNHSPLNPEAVPPIPSCRRNRSLIPREPLKEHYLLSSNLADYRGHDCNDLWGTYLNESSVDFSFEEFQMEFRSSSASVSFHIHHCLPGFHCRPSKGTGGTVKPKELEKPLGYHGMALRIITSTFCAPSLSE